MPNRAVAGRHLCDVVAEFPYQCKTGIFQAYGVTGLIDHALGYNRAEFTDTDFDRAAVLSNFDFRDLNRQPFAHKSPDHV